MNINHAILHVFDFEGAGTTYSARELDLGERLVKSFVQRHLRRAQGSAENKHGQFKQDSMFAGELEHYLKAGDFVAFSRQIAEFLYSELRKGETCEACDLLVADFEGDPVTSAAQNAADELDMPVTEAAAIMEDAAFDGRGERFFAIALLPRKQAYVHDVHHEGGEAVCDVVRHDATLPNPTQKIDSYAFISTSDFSVDFHDKERVIAGSTCMLLPDGLLQCSSAASTKEVMQTVARIVEDVANEYGANAATAVSRAKAVMQEKADEGDFLPPWELGEDVFEDAPQMRERYEEMAREEELPERVHVKKSVAHAANRSHRIRTDTGIEITFPSEYSMNPNFIEFVTQSDGSMSIELKNIGHIENR